MRCNIQILLKLCLVAKIEIVEGWGCRELLLLWGEGYSEKELSVKYGKTASTIGVQTHRCLKKLIPLFKGDELKVN